MNNCPSQCHVLNTGITTPLSQHTKATGYKQLPAKWWSVYLWLSRQQTICCATSLAILDKTSGREHVYKITLSRLSYHTSAPSVLTACTVTPHACVHSYISVSAFSAVKRGWIFAILGTSFTMTCCYWSIINVEPQKVCEGNWWAVSLKVHRWPLCDDRVINVNKYVLVCASGRVFMHLFQSTGCFQWGRTTPNTTLH